MHDHLLQDPDKVRKFVDRFIGLMKLGDRANRSDLCEYIISDELNIVASSCKKYEIYDTLTDNGRIEMLLYHTYEELDSYKKFNPGCCYLECDVYIGLDLQEDSINLRQMQIIWTGCHEGGTTKQCKSIQKCTIEEFKDLDMKKVLIKYPELLLTIDPYEKTDLLIKVLGL
jgi:hypothetical protein